jgi:ribosomal protein L31
LSVATGAIAENLIQDYDKGKSDIEEFRKDLGFSATEIKKNGNDLTKIVITIDELDRCHPTYSGSTPNEIDYMSKVERHRQ